ncbi:MAG: hypothetical protein ACK5JT_04050 [Hyphomicrobiaceae bacterium]
MLALSYPLVVVIFIALAGSFLVSVGMMIWELKNNSSVHPFSYCFVAVIFTALAGSFLVSTGLLIWEFQATDVVTMLTTHSYLFIFFPTLGVVALIAFFIPAVIFTDIYLRFAWRGWARYAIGTLAVAAASVGFAHHLNDTRLRSIWEVSPAALNQDLETAKTCTAAAGLCPRPILSTLRDLRSRSLERNQMSPFIRNCDPDPLLESSNDRQADRFCFPAGRMTDAATCCRIQHAFALHVYSLWENPKTRSWIASVDEYLLAFKCFFIFVIMLIGVFLVAWKKRLRANYGPYLEPMERGLQIGAVVMLFWPMMDYSYQQLSDVLYAPTSRFPLRFSLIVIPWALLLTGYFADKINIGLPNLVKIMGGAFSFVALMKFDAVSDWSAKIIGHGAPLMNFIVMSGFSIAVIIFLPMWQKRVRTANDRDPTGTDYRTDDNGRPMT